MRWCRNRPADETAIYLDVVRRWLWAVVVGLTVGIAARALMRVAAWVGGSTAEFHVGPSTMIVGLFTVTCVGVCAGAVAFGRWPIVGIVVTGLALAPLWLPGTEIVIVEVGAHAKGSLARILGVVAVALMIVGCMVLVSVGGWRIGRGVAVKGST